MQIPLSKPIALGRTAEVYNWQDGRVLKLYHEWCPPHWVENESRVARAVVEAGIPTPAAGGIVEVNGRRGIVYERVMGISMLQDMNAHPWTGFRHARSLAELQVRINQLSVLGLYSYKSGLENAIRNAPHLSNEMRASVLDLLPALPEGDKLCHGDFHPGNIMLTSEGVIVIDWMTACLGSPWVDFNRTSLLLTIGAKAAPKQVNPLIRILIKLLHMIYERRYLELLPDAKNERRKWVPVIAAARLAEQIEPERHALVEMVKRGLSHSF